MAKERLIEEARVIKITILVEKVFSDSTILPLKSPNPIGPTDLGPSKAAQECDTDFLTSGESVVAVSYTHLTLPTNREV